MTHPLPWALDQALTANSVFNNGQKFPLSFSLRRQQGRLCTESSGNLTRNLVRRSSFFFIVYVNNHRGILLVKGEDDAFKIFAAITRNNFSHPIQ